MNINSIKKEICKVSYRLWQKGFTAANDGNISVRLSENRFLITASGISKADIVPEMILEIDGEGKIAGAVKNKRSKYRVSTEYGMHLRCYKERKDINAAVHAHPPFAAAYAAAGIPLDKVILTEVVLTLGGGLPICRYAKPGTQEVADSLLPFLPQYNAFLLQNHGALSLGADLNQAYMRMETIEHLAKISFISSLIGGAKELSAEQISVLKSV